MKQISALTLALLVGLSAPCATAFAEHHPHASATRKAHGAAALSKGLVKKVNRENRTITIRHGELRHLDMPPMTMVFRARSAAMLNGVKAGDQIRFRADKVAGELTVTQIMK